MEYQEAFVIGRQLDMDVAQLLLVKDLAGHLLDGLRIEAAKPVGQLLQRDVNGRLLVALLDMHARLKDLENVQMEL